MGAKSVVLTLLAGLGFGFVGGFQVRTMAP